jgi:hypothetical protein
MSSTGKRLKSRETLGALLLLKSNSNPPVEPLFLKMPSFETLRSELRFAARYFQSLHLYENAKWISELLNSVTDPLTVESKETEAILRRNIDTSLPAFHVNIQEEPHSLEEEDALLQVRSLFSVREYKRCAWMAAKFLQKHPTNQTLLFFKVYSLFLKEKLRREEESAEQTADSFLTRSRLS